MATTATTKKVLTIDDEAAIVELIVDILESNNYEALSATKWTDAVDVLSHGRPDLVLLDLKMPTIHGTSMLEFIRQQGIETPVIIVSGFVTESVTQELYEQGIQGVVKKPFKAKVLIDEIERVLGQPSPPQPAEQKQPQSAMDALYNRAPSSPPEPGRPSTSLSVDALYGGPAEPVRNDAQKTASNPANDILKALQKASPEANKESAKPKNASPTADLLEALQKRDTNQTGTEPPTRAPITPQQAQTPPAQDFEPTPLEPQDKARPPLQSATQNGGKPTFSTCFIVS